MPLAMASLIGVLYVHVHDERSLDPVSRSGVVPNSRLLIGPTKAHLANAWVGERTIQYRGPIGSLQRKLVLGVEALQRLQRSGHASRLCNTSRRAFREYSVFLAERDAQTNLHLASQLFTDKSSGAGCIRSNWRSSPELAPSRFRTGMISAVVLG